MATFPLIARGGSKRQSWGKADWEGVGDDADSGRHSPE